MNDEYNYPEIRKDLIERLEVMRESDQAEIQRLQCRIATRQQRVYLAVTVVCALVFVAQFIPA
jgi:hypothetical protein